nr:MAG: hypothetical protein DiTV3a_F4ORF4 [Diabrotica toursvirus 3a]
MDDSFTTFLLKEDVIIYNLHIFFINRIFSKVHHFIDIDSDILDCFEQKYKDIKSLKKLLKTLNYHYDKVSSTIRIEKKILLYLLLTYGHDSIKTYFVKMPMYIIAFDDNFVRKRLLDLKMCCQ